MTKGFIYVWDLPMWQAGYFKIGKADLNCLKNRLHSEESETSNSGCINVSGIFHIDNHIKVETKIKKFMKENDFRITPNSKKEIFNVKDNNIIDLLQNNIEELENIPILNRDEAEQIDQQHLIGDNQHHKDVFQCIKDGSYDNFYVKINEETIQSNTHANKGGMNIKRVQLLFRNSPQIKDILNTNLAKNKAPVFKECITDQTIERTPNKSNKPKGISYNWADLNYDIKEKYITIVKEV